MPQPQHEQYIDKQDMVSGGLCLLQSSKEWR